MKTTGIAMLLLLTAATGATAKHKTTKGGKNAKDIVLVEAYTQRTLPGVPKAKLMTDTHFVIVWQATTAPETFFWRGDNGFLPCMMNRAHKIDLKKNPTMPRGIEYNIDENGGPRIHKGDTLMITPVTGGKFAIPKEIPEKAKNTLFYKTATPGWRSFVVTTIGKKADIAMP